MNKLLIAIRFFLKKVAIIFLHKTSRFIPDKLYLRLMFRLQQGHKLNLKDPKTYIDYCRIDNGYYRIYHNYLHILYVAIIHRCRNMCNCVHWCNLSISNREIYSEIVC